MSNPSKNTKTSVSAELYAQQKQLIERVEKSLVNHRKSPQDRHTSACFKRRLEILESHYREFNSNHKLIICESDEVTSAYIKEDLVTALEETYIAACGEIESDLSKLIPPVEANHASTSASLSGSTLNNTEIMSPGNSHVRLPPITIPTFDGTYSNWSSFNSLYDSMIHSNTALGNIQKFHYLRSSLTGDAAKVIGEVPLQAGNYDEAYKLLCERYDNKRILFQKHMKSFSSFPVIKTENAASLNRLLNMCKECVCVLKSLGFELKHFEPILVYYLSEKLPHDTREFWVQSSGQSKNVPNFKEITDCIEIRIRTIEEMTSQTEKTSSQITLKPIKKGPVQSINFKHSRSFHVNTQKANQIVSYQCNVCDGHHPIRQCTKFLSMSINDREKVIKNLNYCLNCLAYNHQLTKCPSTRTCGECRGRHHTLLHNPAVQNAGDHLMHSSPSTSATTTTHSNNTRFNCHSRLTPPRSCSKTEAEVLLATVLIQIQSINGVYHYFRALLDSGSQATFVTERAAQVLQLVRNPIRANISGVGCFVGETSRNSVTLHIKTPISTNFTLSVDALILSQLTSFLPAREIPLRTWPHLNGIPLADPDYRLPARIDVILGADAYAQIMMNGIRRGAPDDPIAQETKLGWVLCGRVNTSRPNTPTVSNFLIRSEIDTQIRKFFELETVPDKRILTSDEKWCESFYTRTFCRDQHGRFIVRLPFKTYVDKFAVLGKSRDGAVSRQLQLERKFRQNATLREKYIAVMSEYIELGHMHRVQDTEDEHIEQITPNITSYRCCYIPHQVVYKEDSSTTQFRVVFDAARKTSNGRSLNDIMFTGPPLQNDIVMVILNWRFHRIAFSADIAKMYRQIQVPPCDAEFQRIVWRNHPSEPLQDYAINTVMFGNSCSPYLAIKTIQQLASEEQKSYPTASKVIRTDIYVDDVFSGGDDLRYAFHLQYELIHLLKAGCFKLRKWVSNSSELLSNLPPEDREVQLPLPLNDMETVKTLGIYWQPAEDSLSFCMKFNPTTMPFTKRSVLSVISRLYDPSGWIAPVIVVAKMLLKQLWFIQLDWDDLVPDEFLENWRRFLDGLSDLQLIKIPRWLHTVSSNTCYQLHAYCDASSNAYAAVIYLRTIMDDGSTHVTLLIAKTKIAPVKVIYIPRLELCGALLLAKLLKHVKAGLNFKISEESIFAYSDSKIVLAWLQGDVNRWKVFVANRVSEILETTSVQQWHHVLTNQNPADCATRGMYAKELANYLLWWRGPEDLQQPKPHIVPVNLDLGENDQQQVSMEARPQQVYTAVVLEGFIEWFSSLNKLLRMSVLCSRFSFNSRRKTPLERKTGAITVEEIHFWTQHWIKVVQAVSFPHALNHLKSNKKFSKWKQFLTLNPEFDGEGVLRVGGRLHSSNLSTARKHPIILPTNHHFTTLIIRQAHINTLHGGAQVTLNLIRNKYWILDGRTAVRGEIRKCLICFRHNPKPCQQMMGSLPTPRVKFSRAFTHTGIDYAGPISIRPSKGRGIVATKGYVCIFICLCTKAIHVEAVTDLSSQSFLAAFKRFVARRGFCGHIYSDNGTNFVGAEKIIQRNKHNFTKIVEADIVPKLTDVSIKWHFIPPASPHFGGLWEAGVKSIKHHLRRVIGLSTLTYEEMSTLLCQIEAVLNSRPLCPLTNDPEDLEALTPGHFLIGGPLLAPPETMLLDTTLNPRSQLNRFDLVQKMQQGFAKRWKQEYVSRLQSRPKWLKKERNISVNDMVLLTWYDMDGAVPIDILEARSDH